jgi:hypothetical protein
LPGRVVGRDDGSPLDPAGQSESLPLAERPLGEGNVPTAMGFDYPGAVLHGALAVLGLAVGM